MSLISVGHQMLFKIVPLNSTWTVPGDNTMYAPFDVAAGEYDYNYAGLKSVCISVFVSVKP